MSEQSAYDRYIESMRSEGLIDEGVSEQTQWEYQETTNGGGGIRTDYDQRGRDGWELVAVISEKVSDGFHGSIQRDRAIWKRRRVGSSRSRDEAARSAHLERYEDRI